MDRSEGQSSASRPLMRPAGHSRHGTGDSGRAGSEAPLAEGRGRVPPKLYRIGEVVEYSGFSRQTVHNYTTMGLIREQRWTAGGHRLYDEGVFDRLDSIARLKAEGKSLKEMRELFAER